MVNRFLVLLDQSRIKEFNFTKGKLLLHQQRLREILLQFKNNITHRLRYRFSHTRYGISLNAVKNFNVVEVGVFFRRELCGILLIYEK